MIMFIEVYISRSSDLSLLDPVERVDSEHCTPARFSAKEIQRTSL